MALSLLFAGQVRAQPQELHGQWYGAAADWAYAGQPELADNALTPVTQLSRIGGRFFFQGDFDVRDEVLVLDFKNSSVIGLFHHYIFNAQGRLVAGFSGGIQSADENPFLLRHGRELHLPPGHYRLVTELRSPFLLAQPQPYIDTLQHYRQAIKPGNVLTLVCLGILFSLAFYYGILAIARRNLVDVLYVVFIAGNLVYNMTGLLVFPDLFGIHWFYLISFPFLLFVNWAYILFLIGLLDIRRGQQPKLFRAGMALIALYLVFAVVAFFKPHWSLELVRVAVGLSLPYGLVCGVVRAREGNPTARIYLFAIGAFVAIGIPAILLSGAAGVYTYYVEHLGLLAVTAEAMLLSFVLAQQFSMLHKEKEQALAQAMHNLRAASTDTLTGLPNRFALQHELRQLPGAGSLTFIDLDGLKYYNDSYGHERGDELLCGFGRELRHRLPTLAQLHRLGGDEFAITHPLGDVRAVEEALESAVSELRRAGFELAGASHGSVCVSENPSKENLMNLADERMYQHKRSRKNSVPASA